MPTWMFRTKEAEAERQRAARARRQQAGNCIHCGLGRDDPASKQFCERHLKAARERARIRYQVKTPRK